MQDSPEQLTVHASQFEVYNEQIYDLLAEDAGAVLGQRPTLRLKEDTQGRIFVRGLSEVSARVCIISNRPSLSQTNDIMTKQRCQNISLGTNTSIHDQQNVREEPPLAPCFLEAGRFVFCLCWLMGIMYHVSSAAGSASPAFQNAVPVMSGCFQK